MVVICAQRMREGREESTEHVTLRRYMTIRYDTGLEHRPFDDDASHYVFYATFQKKKTQQFPVRPTPEISPCTEQGEPKRPSKCNEGKPLNVHRAVYF